MLKRYENCKVVKIVDGDTIDVAIAIVDELLALTVSSIQRLRLARINCPELPTEPGKIAKKFVEDLFANNDIISMEIHGHDKYKRFIAEVILSDGRNLSDLLLESGNAVVYNLLLQLS